jgi:hypothetical protein
MFHLFTSTALFLILLVFDDVSVQYLKWRHIRSEVSAAGLKFTKLIIITEYILTKASD